MAVILKMCLLIVLFLTSIPGHILAQSSDCNGEASFNCSAASTPSDRIICSSSELRRADCALGQSYRAARDAAVNDSKKKHMRDQQREWIKSRDRYCGTQPSIATEQCFLNAISNRKSELDGFADGSEKRSTDLNTENSQPTASQTCAEIVERVRIVRDNIHKCERTSYPGICPSLYSAALDKINKESGGRLSSCIADLPDNSNVDNNVSCAKIVSVFGNCVKQVESCKAAYGQSSPRCGQSFSVSCIMKSGLSIDTVTDRLPQCLN